MFDEVKRVDDPCRAFIPYNVRRDLLLRFSG